MAIVADTSAFMAVLLKEPDAASFAKIFADVAPVLVSTATVHEGNCVMIRRGIVDGLDRFGTMLALTNAQIVEFDEEQLEIAKGAYIKFGIGGQHVAELNMGDCFSYALAKSRGLPLLFKGNDFSQTDLISAMSAYS